MPLDLSIRLLPRAVTRAAAALFIAAAVSCGNGGTEPLGDPIGAATVTTTGAYSASGNAVALFMSSVSGDLHFFEITVLSSLGRDPAWELVLSSSTPRLPVGTYTFTQSPGATVYATYLVGGPVTHDVYYATSGELVITSSSTSAVRGTIHLTGTSGTGATVTVDGTFTAKCLADGFCD
jgi:hypothetical protein